MPKPKLYEKDYHIKFEEEAVVDLEMLANVGDLGKNISEVARRVINEWREANKDFVIQQRAKLEGKRGVLNLRKVEPGKYLGNRLLT